MKREVGCLDGEILQALVDGLLGEPDRAAVAQHLTHCKRCRDRATQLRQTQPLLTPSPSSRRPVAAPVGPGTPTPSQPTLLEDSSDAEPVAGEMVDNFRIIRPIDRGGMGQVYLARDMALGRRVALKMVSADSIGSPTEVERFLQEAKTTARFNHPNIVTIHAVGEHRGCPYVALEYLEGQTLRKRLAQGPLPVMETIRIGLAVAEALADAHVHGVLHRDLKPENIFLPRDGRLRVLDFGLAKPTQLTEVTWPPGGDAAALVEKLSDGTFDSSEDLLCGTPAYMAPEQWLERETTGSTDIWALGVILFELLAHRRPYGTRGPGAPWVQVISRQAAPALKPIQPTPPELVQLVADCLAKDPNERPSAGDVATHLRQLLRGPSDSQSLEQCPFRGLLTFAERHAKLFFGRENEVDALVERIKRAAVVPVVGASGAGKSSFVQAGVIPRLRERGPLEVISLRPGRRPFVTLARRLLQAAEGQADDPLHSATATFAGVATGSPTAEQLTVDKLAEVLADQPRRLNLQLQQLAEDRGAQIVLFVDQLEEVFTLIADPEEQQCFLAAICTGADDPELPVRVIFTLREEYLSRLARATGAAEALRDVTVLGVPPNQILQEILHRQAAAVNHRFEDDKLAAEMAAEVSGQPACLPLLQFAGRVLWEQRDRQRRLLTRFAYREMGGVAGALARHADGVLAAMPAEELSLARALLLRLVGPDGTRQVVNKDRLLAGLDPGGQKVLAQLTLARLIVVRRAERGGDEPPPMDEGAELELAHESLLVSWQRLARWIDGSREDLAFLAEVGQAARLWQQRGRPETEVWQGEALRQAWASLQRCTIEVPLEVRAFIDAGRRRAARRRWRRRALVSGAFVAIALVAIALATKEREARRQERRATSQRAQAQLEGARAALLRGELLEARAKLRGALQTRDSTVARLLWWELGAQPMRWQRSLGRTPFDLAVAGDRFAVAADRTVFLLDATRATVTDLLRGHHDQVLSVALSPAGDLLASASWNGEIRLWRVDGPRLRRTIKGHDGGIYQVRFSADGKTLASTGADGTVRLWAVPSGRPLHTLSGHGDTVVAVAFRQDSRLLASASEDRTVRLWSVDGSPRGVLSGHQAGVWSVCFRPDGEQLASAGKDGSIRLWRVPDGRPQQVLHGHRQAVWDVAYDDKGDRLVSAGQDGTIRLWNPRRGQLLRVIGRHDGAAARVRFDGSGDLVSIGRDERIRVWRRQAPTEHHRDAGHAGPVLRLAFSPDGRRLASTGADQTVRIWEVESGAQLRVLRGHEAAVWGLSFGPEGRRLATASVDQTARLWDARTGARLRLFGDSASLADVAFSPDGRTLATGGRSNVVRVFDVADGSQRMRLVGHSAPITRLRFSPDGRLLASAAEDRSVRLWDARSGAPRGVLVGHQAEVWSLSFDPQGRQLATVGHDGALRLWDLRRRDGQVVARLPGRLYGVDFDPSGQRVALASAGGTASILALQSPDARRQLVGHRGEVNDVQFSPDGRLIATSSDDGTVRLWQTRTGRPAWRAPALLPRPARLLSHRGWKPLSPIGAAQRALEREGGFASVTPNGRRLCVTTIDGFLEGWDLSEDRQLFRHRLPLSPPGHLGQPVAALPDGCAAIVDAQARVYRGPAGGVAVAEQARAVTYAGEQLLVAAGQEVTAIDRVGRRRRYRTGADVTALWRTARWLVVGYRDGSIDRFDEGGRRPGISFQEVPAGAVVRLLTGPRQTLIAGYENGIVGIWDLSRGELLHRARLHGAINHLLLEGSTVHAASELGDHLTWDLALLQRDYCAVLREVWGAVPLIWQGGRPHVRPAPADHRCSAIGGAPSR